MNFPTTTRRFASEVAHGGWVVLLLFFSIATGQFVIGHFYGSAWGFAASLVGLAIWLLIRPWRLGLLSLESRREVCIFGTLTFVGWALRTALAYWKI